MRWPQFDPNAHGATFIRVAFQRAASSRMRSGFHRRSNNWSAMMTPLVSAAALRAHPLAQRDVVLDVQLDVAGFPAAVVRAHRHRRLPDQVVRTRRNARGLAPLHLG